MVKCVVADARDAYATKGGGDPEGCWAGSIAPGNGCMALKHVISKPIGAIGASAAWCGKAHGEHQGQSGGNSSRGKHQHLLAPHGVPGMRCATAAFRHVDAQGNTLMPHSVTVKREGGQERLVAHTAAPLPHSRFRAQKVARLSMVYTVYTVSMGTEWVQRSVSSGWMDPLTGEAHESTRPGALR